MTLPLPLAARALVVWTAAAGLLLLALRSGTADQALRRATAVLLLPGLVLFARDRHEDLGGVRGREQARFAEAAARLAPPEDAVLTLWDHVLPFRRAAAFHWFAHDGVLRRLADRAGGTHPLDREYAAAVARGTARIVIADEAALDDHLPLLSDMLAQRCHRALEGYTGSDAYTCPAAGR
jgi:hypothetical protein